MYLCLSGPLFWGCAGVVGETGKETIFMAKKAELHRCRLTIPAEDKAMLEWMQAQTNISISVRQLVHRYIQQYGVTDVTCCTTAKLMKEQKRQKAAEPVVLDSSGLIPDLIAALEGAGYLVSKGAAMPASPPVPAVQSVEAAPAAPVMPVQTASPQRTVPVVNGFTMPVLDDDMANLMASTR